MHFPFGYLALWQFLERGKGVLTIQNINHAFYFNLKHRSNKQTFCKSQKPTLLYQFEIKLILLPNILIAIIGITTE